MWKKTNPGTEYVIAAMRRIAAERGKECHATTTTGQVGVTGKKKARGGYYRICWGCSKLVTKKKEEKPVKDRAKISLLKDWDEIVKRLKRSGYNLRYI